MNWRGEAVEKLRKYDAMCRSLQNIPLEVKRLEVDARAIRGARTDGTPVKGGGSGREGGGRGSGGRWTRSGGVNGRRTGSGRGTEGRRTVGGDLDGKLRRISGGLFPRRAHQEKES